MSRVNAEGLKIEPWDRLKGQRKEAIKSDEQIKQAVHDELVYDPRVEPFNTRVDVENCIVTLSGWVITLRRGAPPNRTL